MEDYSIWFVENSYETEFPNHLTFNDRFTSGIHEMPHGFIYLEGNGHKALIDTGWNSGELGAKYRELYGTKGFRKPADALAEIGVSCEEIDSVIFTHAHLDHAANTEDFPNAIFYIQEHELFESIRMICRPERCRKMVGAVVPEDIVHLLERAVEHRLVLVDGDVKDVLPGIDLYTAFGTHSEGHQFIHIRNENDGAPGFIACGDLVFKYANIAGYDNDGAYVPIVNGSPNGWALVECYDRMMDLVKGDAHRIMPAHEKDINQFYPYKSWSEGLDIVEVYLAEGIESRI